MEKLTIVVFCYNHEKYLSRALDSILSQKTAFDFRVIIADDASTDRSPEIIREYARLYPQRVVPILRQQNLGSMENYRQTLAGVCSEYVVVNDGDDWFSDNEKLQRQVEYLDSHAECVMCFHPVRVEYEGLPEKESVFPLRSEKIEYDFKHLLQRNFMQTNSVMYRWAFNDNSLLQHLPGNMLPGDHFLHLLHAERGAIGFLPEIMSSYFRHDGSIWEGDARTCSWFLRCAEPHINFYRELEKRYGVDTRIRRCSMQLHLNIAKKGSVSLLYQIYLRLLSKIYTGEKRRMYKSLYRMSCLIR